MPRSEPPDSNWPIFPLITTAMRGAPAWARVLLAMIGVAAIVAVAASTALMAAGQGKLAFWVLVLAYVFFCLALGVLLRLALALVTLGSQVLWSRTMPRQPLDRGDEYQTIAQKIEDLRNRALIWVEEHGVAVTIEMVRGHLFLPDYGQAATDGVCELFMPAEFTTGKELLRLRPGDGVAGFTYSTEQPQVVCIPLKDGTPQMPKQYRYTADQLEVRPAGLRWVLTFPLKLPPQKAQKSGSTIGVLTLTGLSHELTEDQLNGLVGHLLAHVIAFAALVGKLPLVRLSVEVQEVQNNSDVKRT